MSNKISKQARKRHRDHNKKVWTWRINAINKLAEVGIQFNGGNREIEKIIKEKGLDFPDEKTFCEKETVRAEVQKASRRIKSTLPCPTNKPEKQERASRIKPTGYKQKSRKSETVNLDNFYESWAWKDLRYQVIKKYGRRCMNCGQSPSKENKVSLHVDHIKPVRKHPELALDINNLQVLCGDCNQGKGFWDETDFRGESNVSISINITEEKLSALHDVAQREYNEAIPPWVN